MEKKLPKRYYEIRREKRAEERALRLAQLAEIREQERQIQEMKEQMLLDEDTDENEEEQKIATEKSSRFCDSESEDHN